MIIFYVKKNNKKDSNNIFHNEYKIVLSYNNGNKHKNFLL